VILATVGLRPGRVGPAYGLVALVAIIGLGASSHLQHNTTIAARAENTDNIYGRLATYEQGFQIFRSAPVFGVASISTTRLRSADRRRRSQASSP
jgi:O-antigen ligase